MHEIPHKYENNDYHTKRIELEEPSVMVCTTKHKQPTTQMNENVTWQTNIVDRRRHLYNCPPIPLTSVTNL